MSVSLIAGILTVHGYIKQRIVNLNYKHALLFLFLTVALFSTYEYFEYRKVKLAEKIRQEYMLNDIEIASKINSKITTSYSGYLAKLSLIVSFFERNKSLYYEEYIFFNFHYETFGSFYMTKYINDEGIIFSDDIHEIEEVVEVGISNINNILSVYEKQLKNQN
jgi:hypothetical protein